MRAKNELSADYACLHKESSFLVETRIGYKEISTSNANDDNDPFNQPNWYEYSFR